MFERGLVTGTARRRATVMALSWLLMLAGVVSALRLPLAFDAPPQPPQLRMRLVAPGVTAATLEQQITRALETEATQALAPRRLETRTSDGVIELRLDFASTRQRDRAETEAARIVERAQQRWPLLLVDTRIERHPPELPQLEYAFSTGEGSLDALRAWIDTTLVRTLADVPGVAALTVNGGPERDVEITVDARRLAGFGLALDELWRALRAAPPAMPATGLAALAVRLPSGETIGIGELAQITPRLREHEAVRIDGRPCVLVEVKLRGDAQLLAVAERIDAQLAWLQSNRLLPHGVHVQAVADARRALRLAVRQTLAGIGVALFLTVGVAAALLSWRRALYATFAAALSVSLPVVLAAPIGVVATPQRVAGIGFGAMLLVPLFGLALRGRAAAFADPGATARAPVVATLAALLAALAALAAFAQDHSAFLTASAVTLAAGALVHRLLAPTLRRAGERLESRKAGPGPRRPGVWAPLALAAAGGVALVTAAPRADLHDSGRATLAFAGPPAAAGREVDAALHEATAMLRGDVALAHVTTRARRATSTVPDNATAADATAWLDPRLSRNFDVARWQQHVLGLVEQLRAPLAAWSITLEDGAAGDRGVAVEILGADPGMLEALAATAIERLEELPGIVRVARHDSRRLSTFHLRADTDRLMEAGLDLLSVERSVSIARTGVFAGAFVDGEARYRAYLRESRTARTQEELAGVLLAGELKDRPALSLGSVAEIAPVSAPAVLQRIDGRHGVRLRIVPAAGVSSVQLARQSTQRLSGLALPAGYEWVVRADGAPRQAPTWDLVLGAAASLLALGVAAFMVAGRARDSAAVMAFAVAVPVLLCGLSFGYGGAFALGPGVLVAGIVAAAARQLGQPGGRRPPPGDAAEALRSGWRFLLPLVAGLLPIALGWLAPRSLSGFAGTVAAGALIATGMLMVAAARADWRARGNK